jgi:hypothetical protein
MANPLQVDYKWNSSEISEGVSGGLIVLPSGTRTSEVAPEHEVEDEKTVLVVLKGITQVNDERVIDLRDGDDSGRKSKLKWVAGVMRESFRVATDLFEQPPLLNDVRDGFLLDAASFVDVLEGVEFLRLLVLDNPDLQWREERGG